MLNKVKNFNSYQKKFLNTFLNIFFFFFCEGRSFFIKMKGGWEVYEESPLLVIWGIDLALPIPNILTNHQISFYVIKREHRAEMVTEM